MNTLTQSQALVHAFLDQTPKTMRIMRACAKLVDGRPRALQDAEVRPLLRDLMRLGYAYTTAPDTWWLAPLGRTVKEAFDAVQEAAKEVRDACL